MHALESESYFAETYCKNDSVGGASWRHLPLWFGIAIFVVNVYRPCEAEVGADPQAPNVSENGPARINVLPSVDAAKIAARAKQMAEVAALVKQLGADDFLAREAAEQSLKGRSFKILPQLRNALRRTKDPEIKVRLKRVINYLDCGWEIRRLVRKEKSFAQRVEASRRRFAMRNGGGRATEKAVNAALGWLVRHQEPDGHWNCVKYDGKQADVAVTGLALLALLGAGHSEVAGGYRDNVRRAVQWLKSVQHTDGKFYKPGETHGIGYHHAIAALAMAEAAGMGRRQGTLISAQRAVAYSVKVHQHAAGGWRYNPHQAGDLSVTGWFILQLKTAQTVGFKLPAKTLDRAARFLDSVEDKEGWVRLYGYKDPNSINYRRTAVGCCCRQLLGGKRADIQGGAEWFVKKGGLPKWGDLGAKVDLYYWHWGTLCAFQQSGELWKRWNDALQKALCPHQRKGGDADGSWDPVGVFSGYWGRAGQTALAALCLEVYYRYRSGYRK